MCPKILKKRIFLVAQVVVLSFAAIKYVDIRPETGSPNIHQKNLAKYRLIAHRGGIVEGIYDEYDPRSIDAAIDSGYWMLEIDVQATADHVLIVHHDDNLERIYGLNKLASELTIRELKKLKAKNGGYAPLTFEEVAQRCQNKVQIMLDLKTENAQPWFYRKLNDILIKYDLLDKSFFISHEVQPYFDGGKFGFRMSELDKMRERLKKGEDISTRFYLFDHGNRINAESARWCQKNQIEVCASVNVGHYSMEDDSTGSERDIEYLKKCGVTIFQIDSQYDQYFNLSGRSKK